jgi:hypothetical protein
MKESTEDALLTVTATALPISAQGTFFTVTAA